MIVVTCAGAINASQLNFVLIALEIIVIHAEEFMNVTIVSRRNALNATTMNGFLVRNVIKRHADDVRTIFSITAIPAVHHAALKLCNEVVYCELCESSSCKLCPILKTVFKCPKCSEIICINCSTYVA